MRGRLFLHIGPPKTATTSLQVAMEKLQHPRYHYAGALQPRERNEGSLAHTLHRGLLDSDRGGGRSAVDRLGEMIAKGHIVFLSEETLSLEQGSMTTADKIAQLGAIFSEFPVTILITLRDPVETLPSLYQELYNGLPMTQRLHFPRFCNSSRTNCLDYQLLKTQLARSGFNEMRWLDFHAITAGRLTTTDVFGASDLWAGRAVPLGWLNQSKRSGNKSSRQMDGLTLRVIGSSRPVRTVIDGLGLRGKSVTRIAATALERISIMRAGPRNLTVPAARVVELRSGYDWLKSSVSVCNGQLANEVDHDRT